MSKKDSSEWFTSVSDVKTFKRAHPILVSSEIEYFNLVANAIRCEFVNQSKERIYTGTIRGSRTAKVKRIVKNVNYWLQRWAATEYKCVSVNQYRDGKDSYGNEFRDYVLDFFNYHVFVYGRALHGRALLHVRTELRPELQAGKFKRWLARKLPFLLNPLKEKYITYFVVVMQLWLDPLHHYDIDVYKIKMKDSIIPPHINKIRFERDEYDIRKRYFQSRKSLSGF